MKKTNLFLTASIFFLICFAACNSESPAVTHSTDDQEHSKEIESLQIKLDATEAQLLNIRSELALCKGDSATVVPTQAQ